MVLLLYDIHGYLGSEYNMGDVFVSNINEKFSLVSRDLYITRVFP